ncbi:hypothetical protein MRY82_02615 [bacterium]|nr:hypothetical protein [bacterium]
MVKKFVLAFCLMLVFFISSAQAEMTAAPGDYSLRIKMGPAFNVQNWEDQMRVGGEFDYELGYSMGVNFLTLFGIGDNFRFQMIPSLRYDYLYIGPASFHGLLGLGYGRLEKDNTLDMRLGTGVILPLGDHYEVTSDLNFFTSLAGANGTPITMEWLLGFGFKF